MEGYCKSQEEKTPPSRKNIKTQSLSKAMVLSVICLEIIALYFVRLLYSNAAVLGTVLLIVSACAFSFISILLIKIRRK